MGRLSRLLSVALLLLSSLLLLPVTAQAAICPRVQVEVQTASDDEMDDICEGASAALQFLAAYGIKPTALISIDLVEKSLEHYGNGSFGSYDASKRRISLMSMQAIRRLGTVSTFYGQPFDRFHYRCVVAHEVAHALFHQNSPNSRLSNSAQEYLAYVTQMAVLSPERRQKIIEHADVSAWESGDSISEIYMAMAPEKFAVKSYLHFTGLADPTAFVQVLLNVKWFYVYVP